MPASKNQDSPRQPNVSLWWHRFRQHLLSKKLQASQKLHDSSLARWALRLRVAGMLMLGSGTIVFVSLADSAFYAPGEPVLLALLLGVPVTLSGFILSIVATERHRRQRVIAIADKTAVPS